MSRRYGGEAHDGTGSDIHIGSNLGSNLGSNRGVSVVAFTGGLDLNLTLK